MAYRLPSVAVITAFSGAFSGRCANYETEPEDAVGYVNMSSMDVFDATARIELERATNRNYFHIRFSHANRYWGISPDSDSGRIKATSLEKDEDISKPTCTLFEPIPSIANFFHLRFAHNGKHVKAIDTRRNFGQLVLDDDRTGTWDEFYQRFSFIGWDTLLKMPKHVAFLGNNDKFLRVFPLEDQFTLLQFSADEGNKLETAFEVIQDGRGRIQLKSAQNNRFWGPGEWVTVDDTNFGGFYWPVRLDNKTIALRTTSGNRFCRRVTQGNLRDILSTSATTILAEARFVVKELVMERQIYDVVYHMDNARIYGLRPVVAGTARATNNTQSEGQQTVTVNFTDESSYTFSNSSSLTTGVSTSITASFGSIVSLETGITMSSERTVSTEFGQAVTRTVSSEASNQVPVPPMSTVIIHYVATEGKCDIPFSYTQRDRRLSDATFVFSKHDDGIYTGVNYFNFHFENILVIKHLPSGM